MERVNTYECMCLLDNREVRKGWEPLKDAVAGLFTKHKAKVLSSRRWDERRLAYPIKGQLRATYLLLYIEIATSELPGLRRELEFSDAILRNLITDCLEVPAGAYEPEEEFDVDAIPVDDAPEVEEPAAEERPTDDGAKAESGDGDAAPADGDAASADGDAPADDNAEKAAATDGGEENKQ